MFRLSFVASWMHPSKKIKYDQTTQRNRNHSAIFQKNTNRQLFLDADNLGR